MNIWFALSKPDKALWVKTHGFDYPLPFKAFLEDLSSQNWKEARKLGCIIDLFHGVLGFWGAIRN